MMQHLREIFKRLNLNDKLLELVNGNIDIPYLDRFNQPDGYWYPHPPGLIPVFLGYGASYYGLLHHFFFDREKTFVDYSLERGYMLEYARNANQFFTQMVLDMDMVAEGLNDRILKFCEDIAFKEFKQVDEFADEYGDAKDDFEKLVHLKSDTPLSYVKSLASYNGDYPASTKLFNAGQIFNCCTFEIAESWYLNNIDDLPEWFRKEIPQAELFESYLENNDLKSAWLTLNSSGWKLKDVAEGLKTLMTKTHDPLFHLIAVNWIEGFQSSDNVNTSY